MAIDSDQIPPGLVRVDEAAAALNVAKSTLHKWVRRGLVTGYRSRIGQGTYVSLEELRAARELRPLDMTASGAGASEGDA